jgi:hypothetical protein
MSVLRSSCMVPFKSRNKIIPGTSQSHSVSLLNSLFLSLLSRVPCDSKCLSRTVPERLSIVPTELMCLQFSVPLITIVYCFCLYYLFSILFYSRDSAVGTALGYALDDRGSRVRFSAGAGNFSLHHRVQNGSGAYPASYPMGTRGSFLGVKRPGRGADHSTPSSAEVKE